MLDESDADTNGSGDQDDAPAEETLSPIQLEFNNAKERKLKSVHFNGKNLIEKLHDAILDLRTELNTKDIGFEIATIPMLHELGVKNAKLCELYVLVTVGEAKFLGQIQYTDIKINYDDIITRRGTELDEYFTKGSTHRLSDDVWGVQNLKRKIAGIFGELSAEKELSKYNIPPGQAPVHIFKTPAPKP